MCTFLSFTDTSKNECKKTDSKWFSSKNIYVNKYHRETSHPVVSNSSHSCKLNCENKSDSCTAVVYNKVSNICHMYEESVTFNYEEVLIDTDKEDGFVRICNLRNASGEF